MKVLQINTTVNSGSTGRIASEIGDLLIDLGHESIIAYGRKSCECSSLAIKIGTRKDFMFHVIHTRLFDRHGFSSRRVTEDVINSIKQINPDIIHLHNIHGYYLHIGILFGYLKKAGKPVVWTLHDCWPFTGHCSHFQYVNCNKWQTECHDCPNTNGYPKSWLVDNSRTNYRQKRELFQSLDRMVIVSPSEWLARILRSSFLSDYEIKIINNGVDLGKFRPLDNTVVANKYNLKRKYILGVASIWTERKGLGDFFMLRKILDPEIEIVLVGLSQSQARSMPIGVTGIARTENTDELAALYTGAEIFVNPTYVDNFPSVNIEDLACGTPVVAYNTGGTAETLDEKTGFVIEKGDINGLALAVNKILQTGKKEYSDECRLRAMKLYDKRERYAEYISIYQNIIAKN